MKFKSGIYASAFLMMAAMTGQALAGVGRQVTGAGKGAGKETRKVAEESGTEVWGATIDALGVLFSLPVRLAETIGSGGESTQARLKKQKAGKTGRSAEGIDAAEETGEMSPEQKKEVLTGFARITNYLAGMAGGVTEETTGPTFDALKGLGGAAVTTLKEVIVLPFRILNSAATGGKSAGVGADDEQKGD